MTDKQPEALRLADELEDSLESHDGSSLTARCQGIANDAASELRRLCAELETLTLYKSLADEYGLSIFPDIAEMTAELETLRVKLKVYEDLGGAADDVQLLRMGYAAARLEIESLQLQLTDQGRVLEKVMHELVQTHRPTNGAQTTTYAACYTSCIHESSMKTLSLHATRSGAESAVAEHKRAQRALYDEWADEKYQATHPWSDQKGCGHEAWTIDEFEVLP